MRRRIGDPVLLAAGSVVSGLLAYVLFALVTRGLGGAGPPPRGGGGAGGGPCRYDSSPRCRLVPR